MKNLARFLVVLGLVITVTGLLFPSASRLPWFGNLPGDIRIRKENGEFRFPIMTSIVVSLVLTLLLNLLLRLKR